jgi:hypothetical protein
MRVMLVLATMTVPVAGCFGRNGPACESTDAVVAHVAASSAQVLGGTATLCVNSNCADGVFMVSDLPGDSLATLVGSALEAYAQVMDQPEGSAYLLVELGSYTPPFVDGDIYSVEIADGSAAIVFAGSGAATYTSSGQGDEMCTNTEIDL